MSKDAETIDVTVTYLEMTAPPARRWPLPLGVNAAILHAEKPQLAFYRFLQLQVGYPWKWEYRLRMDEETLTGIIHADTSEIYVLYLDGAPAGFYEVNRADDETTDLAYFGLMPHAAGRGLGRWFLGQAIETCWAGEPQRITVNTCTADHPAALPLYQKLGFEPLRREEATLTPLTVDDLHRLGTASVGATG